MLIELKGYEMMQGALCGIMRQLTNLKKGHKNAHGLGNGKDWQVNVEGALAEMALAKFLDVYWTNGEFRAPDVGVVDVRSTHHMNGCLIVHDEDDSGRVFWLLTGENGKYTIRGWMYGYEAQNKEKYWKDPVGGRPAYFVPQSDLHKADDRPMVKP